MRLSSLHAFSFSFSLSMLHNQVESCYMECLSHKDCHTFLSWRDVSLSNGPWACAPRSTVRVTVLLHCLLIGHFPDAKVAVQCKHYSTSGHQVWDISCSTSPHLLVSLLPFSLLMFLLLPLLIALSSFHFLLPLHFASSFLVLFPVCSFFWLSSLDSSCPSKESCFCHWRMQRTQPLQSDKGFHSEKPGGRHLPDLATKPSALRPSCRSFRSGCCFFWCSLRALSSKLADGLTQ